jgi:hypothetical protein
MGSTTGSRRHPFTVSSPPPDFTALPDYTAPASSSPTIVAREQSFTDERDGGCRLELQRHYSFHRWSVNSTVHLALPFLPSISLVDLVIGPVYSQMLKMDSTDLLLFDPKL